MLSWAAIIVLFVLVIKARNRIEELQRKAEQLDDALANLRGRQPEQRVGFSTAPTARPLEPPTALPVSSPAYAYTSATRPPIPVAPAAMTEVETPVPDAETRPEAIPVAAATAAAPIRPAAAPLSPPSSPPPPPPRAAVPAPPPQPPAPPFDWEQLIGVKLFSWIAGAALALGAVFFLKYSVQQGWLRPEIRMGLGLITGLGLLIACEMKAARRYTTTANALDASGIAILFATVYASFALWHLVPSLVAFALLVLVTATAVLLSIRRESMFIAVLGLLGGFATPALLSSGQDNPIGLFGYLLLLNTGLAWVAYKKRWPALTGLCLVFTTLYQWGWVMKFLTADKLPLAVGIFLVFPIVSLLAFSLGRSRAAPAKDESLVAGAALFEHGAHASAALPLLFSLYLAAVPAYGAHFGILFGFLLALTVGLFAIAITQGPRALHFLGALSTVGVFAIWFSTSYGPAAWPWLLAFIVAFVALYLLAPIIAERRDVKLDGLGGLAVFAAPLLLFSFPVLLGVEPRAAAPLLPFGVLFVLVGACAAYAIGKGEGAVHFVAAFFAIAAEAVWSAKYLDAKSLYAGLGLYGIFGLFYVGTPAIARRFKRPLAPAAAAGLLTLSALALLFFVAVSDVAASALWGMALLIAILNLGLISEARHSRMPVLSLIGAMLSWVILAVWWFIAGTAAVLLPALVVIGGFGILTMAGNTWARHRAEADAAPNATEFNSGAFSGLVGHVFIAFLVMRPELSIPPWPIFGVLAALQIAVLAATLFRKSGSLQLAGAVATAIILAIWTTNAPAAPWPLTAVIASGVLVALTFVGIPLAKRISAPLYEFELAAGLAALLAQVVAIFAQLQTGAPSAPVLVVAYLAFIIAALSLSWIEVDYLGWAAVAAVVPAMTAAVLWAGAHNDAAQWLAQIEFAAPLYLAFIVHPLALGRRAGAARSPFFAAVLGSAGFFVVARHALVLGGHENVIGALPLTEALLLAPVLSQLVKLERERLARKAGATIASDRLVLVAGAVLALVTAAIPLQLEKNWITIAWALEGAALLWLCRKLPHGGLLTVANLLLLAVFVRLTINPAVLTYHPRGAYPILNWYLYTYLICAAAMYAAARLVNVDGGLQIPVTKLVALFTTAGTVLLFFLLNIEIADYYSKGPTITFNFSASLAQDLTYSIGWAAFALAMLAAGIIMRNRSTRLASIILFVVTVLKCFLHDLGRLGGLYRVGSLVGLAISLALVALALQRFVLARNEPSTTAPA